MNALIARTALLALVIVAAACNKVSQDQFDQSMAHMQAQLDEHQAGIASNGSNIAEMQAQLDALQVELEKLAEEYEVAVTRFEDHIQFVTPVNFDFDSSEIRAADHAFLDRFAIVVGHHYAGSLVTVQGYADPAGPAEYNQRLSEKRAQGVASYLVETGGLATASVRAIGFGEEHAVAPGEWGDSEGGLKNRRVTFVVESVVR
jgi:peptidoglycan-associated lipoprotein